MSEPYGTAPLVGLLLAHQRRAWREGRPSLVENYLGNRPALVDDDETVLDLITNEMILRAEAGDLPRLEEYLERFPRLAPQLELQFALEDALRSEPRSGADATTVRNGDAPPTSTLLRPVIPGYELVGELGRGGMGVVYQARQLRLNRIVALKMILAGAHASPEATVRFLAEAEAVARLHHPNIVQIYALGDHDGHPYYEMEYAPGGSLAERLDGTPWPAREAARLVEVLAVALSEAHRLGIVHRDLKPANVLLGADGTPKVADFGLAKWLDLGSGLTRTDHIVGSPSYMAPEQAGGCQVPIGPPADVYSLGAILYELLTGRPPFRAATALETLEQVKSADPVSPARLRPGLPRDLETICLKCLAKEPARRYADMRGLAEDLRRFDAGEPIRARPVALWERAWRWCRRQPALASLVAVLAAGFVGVATQSYRAERHLRREIAASRALEAARRRSQARFELGMRAVSDYFTLASEDELLKNPQLESIRKKLLGHALEFYKGLQASLESDTTPEARVQLAEAYTHVAGIQVEMDLKPEALASHRRALALWEGLMRGAPDRPKLQSNMARSHVFVGSLERGQGRAEEAMRSFERALAIEQELVRRHPSVDDYKGELAWCLGNIGALQAARGQTARAVRSHESAVAIGTELLGRHPRQWNTRRNLAWCLDDLATTQEAEGRYEQARATCQRAGSLWEDLLRENPGDAFVRSGAVRTHLANGKVLRMIGRWDEALRSCETALAMAQSLATQYPFSAHHKEQLAWSLSTVGTLSLLRGDSGVALGLQERALALREALLRDDHADPERQANVASSQRDVGLASEAAGRTPEGLAWIERAVASCERLVRSYPADHGHWRLLADGLSDLGIFRRRTGDPRAGQTLERMVTIRERLARDRPDCTTDQVVLISSYLYRATIHAPAGRTDLALADIQRAERLIEQAPRVTPNVHYNLACAYALCSAGRRECRSYADRAMEALRRASASGFKFAALVRRDPDLDPLRQRADFQSFMLDLAFPADPFVR